MPLIMNTAAHTRALPPPHPKKGEKQTLQPHVLFPGPNKVGDEEWAEAKKLPVIQALLEDGVLAEIKSAGKKKVANELSDLKEVEQVKLVKETTDQALLLSWREDAPTAVLKAIDDRIEELKAGPGGKKK
jgi:hypothetical protein